MDVLPEPKIVPHMLQISQPLIDNAYREKILS